MAELGALHSRKRRLTTYFCISQFEKSLPDDTNLKLVESIENNTKHYVDLFSEAVDGIMPKETEELT
jgi:DNA replication licensing factor MCM7